MSCWWKWFQTLFIYIFMQLFNMSCLWERFQFILFGILYIFQFDLIYLFIYLIIYSTCPAYENVFKSIFIWSLLYIFLLSSIPHLDFIYIYIYSSFLLFYFYITWKEVEMYSSVYRPCWRARVAAFVRHPPGCLRWRHRVPVAARYVHFRQHRRRTRLFFPLMDGWYLSKKALYMYVDPGFMIGIFFLNREKIISKYKNK